MTTKLILAPAPDKLDRLYKAERKRLMNALDLPTLTGLEKLPSKGTFLTQIANALSDEGFTLDMVPGDEILGDKGHKVLRFRRTHPDAFEEHPEITNAGISFSWENLETREFHTPRFEVIAYVS